MTTLINRIGRKTQLALASAMIAASLLATGAATANAQPYCPDFNGDGRVSISDVAVVRSNFGTLKPDGTRYSIIDILRVLYGFGQTC